MAGSPFARWTIVVFLASFFSLAGAEVLLPYPNGRFEVGFTTMELVDEKRTDPFAPTPQPRAIICSTFYPVVAKDCQPKRESSYMPPRTAAFEDQEFAKYGIPNGTFEQIWMETCEDDSPITIQETFPVVLFSPALGSTRLLYQAIARKIASAGYIVISIDHPYDADIVEFPDGSIVMAGDVTKNIELAVSTRAADASFVLDRLIQMKHGAAADLIQRAPGGLGVGKVGMFGHSLGGAATASAMLNDDRILGGLNFDGTLFGPVVDSGLNRSLLLWGRESKNVSDDPSWDKIWPHLQGFKLALTLDDSQHMTFSDLPLLVKILGFDGKLPPEAGERLGTLDGARVLDIIGAYATAFFDFVLRGVNSTLLESPSLLYPEVKFGTPEDDTETARSPFKSLSHWHEAQRSGEREKEAQKPL